MDKIIKGNIVDVHRRMIYPGKITISGKYIKDIVYDEECKGLTNYIVPGFVDSHIHIESTLLSPTEFCKLAVKYGTVATVSDPHEIANVLGLKGVDYMINEAKKSPLKFNFGAPSCVPATKFETAGAELNALDVKILLERKEIKFLSEMMNWPGVLEEDEEVMAKIEAAKSLNKPVDGHAPGLSGDKAKLYASKGITTDHECTQLEEALDKIEGGMKIQIREGSAAKNFDALSTLLNSHAEHLMFCTDDTHPHELINGHIDLFIRRAFALGADIFEVLKIASINPIEHYNLDVGQLRKGDLADFVIVETMSQFIPIATYINGEAVYENKEVKFTTEKPDVINNFQAREKTVSEFFLDTKGKRVQSIVVEDGQLITKKEIFNSTTLKANDVLKLAVVNRYRNEPPAIAFIKGIGLEQGAIASTVAHDSHNIIAVGHDDQVLCEAVNEVINMKGGLVITNGFDTHSLPLPIAGLMSDKEGTDVAEDYINLLNKAKSFGSKLHDPFLTLSFVSLLVIPELKLSDKGLFDAKNFKFTNPLINS
ncbi:adenine deaminase [Flammeovirga yaeyamensis]|uniref:Adenine deaminase n=1 Tax=Flammeovirga yaeyamensis TaxID=367791 RepID=A0AAX1MY01_9BACT|nr:adenine deaminase [Flammeovirga yaeyamensis]MBB3696383.1 adenine deaminase [Flammeovirga yaeyamensis]NMF35062.1 adenine deaminase [Flammeovirga yaeyamensis]QWG00115.1 adenine deaminase [Flammeovirga yaeyamensis]